MNIKRTVVGVGFLGGSKYQTRINGVELVEYGVWRSMIRRCYSAKAQIRDYKYFGCEVHSDWHNFQRFADWYLNHESSGLGYDVDKDLLVRGNKTYSPENCCLLPAELNSIIQTGNIKSVLVGTTFHKQTGMWQAQVKNNGRQIFLGLFESRFDAHLAYVEAKEAYVRERADYWRGRIEDRAYSALMNWRVVA